MQYGGRILYRDGVFKTADGKGHFSALLPPELELPAGKFALSTRRGKQFNSLIHAKRDTMTGANRDALLISQEDATALGVHAGDSVLVRRDNRASLELRVRNDRIKPRNAQAFWPECNPLIRRRTCDIAAGVPDYNALVEIIPITAEEAREPQLVGAAPA